jgi:hypothetical protein
MGGRKNYDSKVIFGGSAPVTRNIGNLHSTLHGGNNNKAVNATLLLLASSDPAIGTIIFATKVLKLAYEVYLKTQNNYEETGDYTSAIAYAVAEVAGREISEKKELIIEEGVTIIWNKIKEQNGIVTPSNQVDEIVISAVSEVITENLR